MTASSIKLVKGVDNSFDIKIKQNNSLLPMVIEPSDTFTLHIIDLATRDIVGSITSTLNEVGQLVVSDAANGKLTITILASFINTMKMELGAKADFYYSKVLYKCELDAMTVNNGPILAEVKKLRVG